ncbi:YjjW family glycine radical enzyme activase [Enterobacillus tribolii]|uniref:YjjW family glycine radical enzyme activase n=1 Tax=Enterobacillus tribolii TaxID=1487935 RepID=A0A370QQ87_9GAMM|nr:YjjW family glycine radical enzyme activase [Enterobacillus tribolii]MBW7981547.1 YjjW family glycine radical enzyme activase [Enterobacillus tribolii]RDK90924.1 YjjW family glycine radical enzyme activase [Enterobacillus tribolii]
MSSQSALINTIFPFSCVDGPGNRLALFLQGCNMQCKGCHNPYTIGLCNQCGDCLDVCPNRALSIEEGTVIWNEQRCQRCDTCLNICPRHASPQVRRYSIEQILDMARRYAPFINGLTVSGGEATLQLPFLTELFRAIKQEDALRHLTCMVDSNGTLAENGWQQLLPWMDGAMIDLKAWDEQCHIYLTGRGNARIRQTTLWLAEQGKLNELRLLLIPEQTDYLQHIDALSEFILTLGSDVNVRLNAFHHHGVRGEARAWPNATQEHVETLAAELEARGVERIIRPALYLP